MSITPASLPAIAKVSTSIQTKYVGNVLYLIKTACRYSWHAVFIRVPDIAQDDNLNSAKR
ncbi:hypothetical protein PPE03_17330 [Pseudoalteromonas peptidolytica]|nr:hypothetical protein PPE03_17330 [Pseudoalteromonas peptidolytica]